MFLYRFFCILSEWPILPKIFPFLGVNPSIERYEPFGLYLTSDVVLMDDDLEKLPYFVSIFKRANRVVKQNIVSSLSCMF